MKALHAFGKNFKYAFLTKAFAALAFGLLKRKNLVYELLSVISPDTFNFSMFLGSLVGGYKAVLAALKKIRGKDDGLNPAIAGFLAGFSMFFQGPGKLKKFLIMAFVMRALDTGVQLLDRKKIFKKIKYFECYMFGPIIGFLVYVYFYERPVFPPGIDKAFLATAVPSKQELVQAHHIFLRQGIRWFPGAAKKIKA